MAISTVLMDVPSDESAFQLFSGFLGGSRVKALYLFTPDSNTPPAAIRVSSVGSRDDSNGETLFEADTSDYSTGGDQEWNIPLNCGIEDGSIIRVDITSAMIQGFKGFIGIVVESPFGIPKGTGVIRSKDARSQPRPTGEVVPVL